MLGDTIFWHLYKEYMIFLKTRDESLVQISGTNIFCYLSDRLGRLQSAFYEGGAEKNEEQEANKKPKKVHIKSHKYNLKVEGDSYVAVQKATTFYDEQINRNRVFYCSHMNRKTEFFQKHILNDKKQTPEAIRDKIFKDIFGFNRMRSELKGRVIGIIDHVVKA